MNFTLEIILRMKSESLKINSTEISPTFAAKETKAWQCKIIQINLKVLQIIRDTFRMSSEIHKITEYKVKRGQRHAHEATKLVHC